VHFLAVNRTDAHLARKRSLPSFRRRNLELPSV
jgi:hypothetical protein